MNHNIDIINEGDKTYLISPCPFCGEDQKLEITSDEANRLFEGYDWRDIWPMGRMTQRTMLIREMFISGICNDCFPKEE